MQHSKHHWKSPKIQVCFSYLLMIIYPQIWSGYQLKMLPMISLWLYTRLTPSYCGTQTLASSSGRKHSLILLFPWPSTRSNRQILHVREKLNYFCLLELSKQYMDNWSESRTNHVCLWKQMPFNLYCFFSIQPDQLKIKNQILFSIFKFSFTHIRLFNNKWRCFWSKLFTFIYFNSSSTWQWLHPLCEWLQY